MKRNVLANLIGKGWNIVSVFIFTPLYIKLLGVESYGLVGFYSTLLVILAFADMGFTATLSREMAKFEVSSFENKNYLQNLLRSYEVFYLAISSLIAIIIWITSPLIVHKWLHISERLNTDQTILSIRLMGIAIALQLPSDLYFGGLMGLQKQLLANSVQIAWGIFRSVGAIALMWFYSPTIIVFAAWQLIANSLYFILIRLSLWKLVKTRYRAFFDINTFKLTWKYSVGMVGLSLISIFLTQSDKLIISRFLPLKLFSYYSIASTVSSVPLLIATPVAMAVFPRMVSLLSMGNIEELKNIYLKFSAIISVLIFSTSAVLLIYIHYFIILWTGSTEISDNVKWVARFLILGQVFQAVTLLPYFLALTHGNVKVNLYVGICSIFLYLPLLVSLVSKYGILGGGISWFIVNLIITPIYMYYLHYKFMSDAFLHWLKFSILTPLTVSSFLGLFFYYTDIITISDTKLWLSAFLVITWIVMAGLCYLVSFKRIQLKKVNQL